MKTVIMLAVLGAILLLVTGCGPGQPFEIEGQGTPQTAASTAA